MNKPRAIILDSCTACPHMGRAGGFGTIGYVPKCRNANRELGYWVGYVAADSLSRTRPVASYDGKIPDWCPLPVHENHLSDWDLK